MKREQLIVSGQTKKGMSRPPGAGRKPGTLNKTTAEVREVFIEVFQRLGGVDAMLRWAQESPQNRYAFYVKIYPKLMPNNPVDPSNTLVLERIERVIVHHDSERARRGGWTSARYEAAKCSLIDAEWAAEGGSLARTASCRRSGRDGRRLRSRPTY